MRPGTVLRQRLSAKQELPGHLQTLCIYKNIHSHMIWRLSISAVKIGQVSQSFTCKNCSVSVSTGNISICNVHIGKCKYAPMSVFGDLDHSCLKLFLMFICRLIFFLCFSPKSQRGSKLSSNERIFWRESCYLGIPVSLLLGSHQKEVEG